MRSTATSGTVSTTDCGVWCTTMDRWLPYVLRAAALGLGALHTLVAVKQQSMNEDGINYLDMGTAIVNGHWQAARNSIWSPFYSVVLGTVVHVVQPSVWWEFPVVHMVNFVIFAVATFCFDFFWRELTVNVTQCAAGGACSRFPPAGWLTLGYSLWIWSSLSLIGIWAVTPDMLVAACVFVASGLLLRIGRDGPSPVRLAAFGAVLGVSYLAKAVMFPLGLVCLVLAAAVLQSHWRWATLWTLVAFAAVAGPFVMTLSLSTGHLTFGHIGRFTYMKHVNRLRYPHWEETARQVNGVPTHAPRRVHHDPPVYEFGNGVGGTYPMSFDPGYWTRGLSPRIVPRQQVDALASNGMFYFDLFARRQGAFASVVVLLALMAVRPWFRRGSGETALVLWALSAFALYSLVYVSPRYVAAFVVIFWAGLLACIRLPDTLPYRRLAAASTWTLVLAVWINIAAANVEGLGKVLHFSPGLPSDPGPPANGTAHMDTPSNMHPAIAEGLRHLGVGQGDTVGFLGYSFSAFWARLARVRIVAELEPQHAAEFWSATGVKQDAVLRAFATAGARAVVSEPARTAQNPPGWVHIGNTGYLVYFLR